MAAGLPNSRHIIINGFITGADGQKMSKSLGNVISPFDVLDIYKEVTDYPEDVLRFVLLHDLSSFEDGGISLETIKASYQAHLQNGIGNLTNRIMKMSTTYGVVVSLESLNKKYFLNDETLSVSSLLTSSLENFNISDGIKSAFSFVNNLDKVIQEKEPYKMIKTDEVEAKKIVEFLLHNLYVLGLYLEVFLPDTSAKILECIRENKMPEKPLFNRFV